MAARIDCDVPEASCCVLVTKLVRSRHTASRQRSCAKPVPRKWMLDQAESDFASHLAIINAMTSQRMKDSAGLASTFRAPLHAC